MKFDPDIHKRKSLRLKNYDYSRQGAYFLTICTKEREHIFGEIQNGEMKLTNAGSMVKKIWDELNDKYPGLETNEFIIMPNHIHGIITLNILNVGAGPRACPGSNGQCVYPGSNGQCVNANDKHCNAGHTVDNAGHTVDNAGQPRGVCPYGFIVANVTKAGLSLPDVIHRFKSYTTAQYRIGVIQYNWPPFPGKLWQRNYYERIIRNENELMKIREYILNNPLQWDIDEENTAYEKSRKP